METTMNGWYGFDLDGTLAVYDGWRGPEHIGEPIPAMVNKVKELLVEGKEVRIFTARVAGVREGIAPEQNITLIQDWTEKHIGVRLPVTCTKDFGMVCLFDDRAKQVIPNTGLLLEDEYYRLK